MAESLQYAPRPISLLPLLHMAMSAPHDILSRVAHGTSLLIWLGPMPSSAVVQSNHKLTDPILVENPSATYR